MSLATGPNDKTHRTPGTGAYRPEMCEWILQPIVDDFLSRARNRSEPATSRGEFLKTVIKKDSSELSARSNLIVEHPEGGQKESSTHAQQPIPTDEAIRTAAAARLKEAMLKNKKDQEAEASKAEHIPNEGWVGRGEPMMVGSGPRRRQLVDGGGLCSPGQSRTDVTQKALADG